MDDQSTATESTRYFSSLTRNQTNKSFLTRPFGSRKIVGNSSGDKDRNPVGLTTVFNLLGETEADVIFIHGLGGDPVPHGAKMAIYCSFGRKYGYPRTSHSEKLAFILLAMIRTGLTIAY